MIVLNQGRLVFIWPECKVAMSMDVERRTYLTGGFNCECGTVVTFTLDTRRSIAYGSRGGFARLAIRTHFAAQLAPIAP